MGRNTWDDATTTTARKWGVVWTPENATRKKMDEDRECWQKLTSASRNWPNGATWHWQGVGRRLPTSTQIITSLSRCWLIEKRNRKRRQQVEARPMGASGCRCVPRDCSTVNVEVAVTSLALNRPWLLALGYSAGKGQGSSRLIYINEFLIYNSCQSRYFLDVLVR